ncbi:MAG: fibronectin type III domain-containing protein, partial [Thermoguttaceae bacterium]
MLRNLINCVVEIVTSETQAAKKKSRRGNAKKTHLKHRSLQLESLETRELLSVSLGEFEQIRNLYADLNLSANFADYNVIEITASQLSAASLQTAIDTAAQTVQNDLIVVRTTAEQNTITLEGNPLFIDIDQSQHGSVAIVALSSIKSNSPLVINTQDMSRAFRISNSNVYLANTEIIGTTWSFEAESGYDGLIFSGDIASRRLSMEPLAVSPLGMNTETPDSDQVIVAASDFTMNALGANDLAAPYNLVAERNGNTIKFAWTPDPGAPYPPANRTFLIYYTTNPSSKPTNTPGTIYTTSVSYSNLYVRCSYEFNADPNETYYIYVREQGYYTVHNMNTSLWQGMTSEPNLPQLPTPTLGTVSATAPDKISVAWSGASNVLIQYTNQKTGVTDTKTASGSNYTLTNLDPNTQYSVRIKATASGYRDSDYTSSKSATTQRAADLAFATPNGWALSLFVTNSSSEKGVPLTLLATDSLYFNYAYTNISPIAVTTGYTITTTITGSGLTSPMTFTHAGKALTQNQVEFSATNFSIGKLNPGTYTIKVELDSGKNILEESKTNNTSSLYTFTVKAPDIAVSNGGSVTSNVIQGNMFSVTTGTIQNIGNYASGGYTVTFYASTSTSTLFTSGINLGSETMVSLNAGESTTATLNFMSSESLIAGSSYYIGWVISGVTGETVTKNNSAYTDSSIAVYKSTLARPEILTIETLSTSSLQVSWEKVANATGYYVNGTYFSGGTTTSGVLSGLSSNTTYSISVTAAGSNLYANSLPSDTRSATTQMAPSVTSKTTDSIKLSWSSVTGAGSYDVWYRAVGSTKWSLVSNVSSGYSLAGLNDDTSYEVQIRAIKSGTTLVLNSGTVTAKTNKVFTVTSTSNTGAGSLRQAVADAVAGDKIVFASSLVGQTVILSSSLSISKNITIDASSLYNAYTATPGLTLSRSSGTFSLLMISGGCTVSGLVITNGNAASGGAVLVEGTANISKCMIVENTANMGGGGIVVGNGANLTIRDSVIAGNQSNFGGGIAISGGTLHAINCVISGNIAGVVGGSGGNGGGVHINNGGNVILTNCTVAGNTAGQGGGVYNDSGIIKYENYIIEKNFKIGTSTISDIGGLSGTGGATGYCVGDPKFISLPTYYTWTKTLWRTWNLRLQSGSGAIDCGDNSCIPANVTADIAGNARLSGTNVDAGAYEYISYAPMDLTFGTPSGWSQSQVVSTLQNGIRTTDNITTDDVLYANFAVLNKSNIPTTANFDVKLELFGPTGSKIDEFIYTVSNGIAAGQNFSSIGNAWNIGKLAITGQYKLQMTINPADSMSESDRSNNVSYTTFTLNSATTPSLVKPTINTPSNATSSSVDLTWSQSVGASGYTVAYRVQGTTTWYTASCLSPCTLTGLRGNTTYEFRVQAVGNNITAADSVWSDIVSVKTLPSVPINLRITGRTGSSIALAWDIPVGGAVSYKLEYSSNGTSGWTQIGGTVTTSSYTHSLLLGNVAYYYRITAVSALGNSYASSTIASKTNNPIKLSTPTLGTVSATSPSAISVSWTAVANASAYAVRYTTDSSFTTGVMT